MTDTFFSPAFGNKPIALIGRTNEMGILTSGLYSPPGSKERARLIIGQRGMGKTVLLLELAEFAKNNGFIVASPTVVSNDMLERILEKLNKSGESVLQSERPRITGGSVGILGFSAGIQTEKPNTERKSFAYQLQEICETAGKAGKGVLILVDEVQSGNESLKKLIIAYQEMVGEGCNISMVLAGLPSAISQTLNEHVLTFLNRASKMNLDPISISEIIVYYNQAFEKFGIKMSDKWTADAARRTEGSPYMMQLIGHYLTITASEDGKLTEKAFRMAIELATKEFVDDICSTTLAPLSERDISFLKAMSVDEKETSIKDLCIRLNESSAYVNVYRQRLLQAGVIIQRKRGFVEMAVPYLKDYLSQRDS